jgi:hypothetical protein
MEISRLSSSAAYTPPSHPAETAAGARGATDDTAADTRATASAVEDPALSEAEQREVSRLQTRDQQVRRHEAAHLAAAGGLANGGPQFSYQSGPDGKRYAVGGEVSIDISPASTPEQTIAKARTIRAAALAPADPSAADRAIAAKAAQMAADAATELARSRAQAAHGDEAPNSVLAAYRGQGDTGDAASRAGALIDTRA